MARANALGSAGVTGIQAGLNVSEKGRIIGVLRHGVDAIRRWCSVRSVVVIDRQNRISFTYLVLAK